jgi:hypothetical protein
MISIFIIFKLSLASWVTQRNKRKLQKKRERMVNIYMVLSIIYYLSKKYMYLKWIIPSSWLRKKRKKILGQSINKQINKCNIRDLTNNKNNTKSFATNKSSISVIWAKTSLHPFILCKLIIVLR